MSETELKAIIPTIGEIAGKARYATDYAKAKGVHVYDNKTLYDNKTSPVLSRSSFENGNVRFVSSCGDEDWTYPYDRYLGVCPALPSESESSQNQPSEARLTRKNGDVFETSFVFPQTEVSKSLSKELNALLKQDLQAIATGKGYTCDSAPFDAYDTQFTPKQDLEYAYKGQKYVRVEGKGEARWFKVENIEAELINGKPIATKVLTAGIRFAANPYKEKYYNKSDMAKYMEYFSQEIIPSKDVKLTSESARTTILGDWVRKAAKTIDRIYHG
jgi:hypothetical protein